MTEPPASKAAGFTTTAQVIREDADVTHWRTFLSALPPDTRALVDKPPLPVAWLEIRHFAALIDGARVHVYGGDAEGITRVARRSIFRDLNGLYKMFIRLASPMQVMSRAATIWDKYNRNHGMMIAESTGQKEARVTIKDVLIGSPAFWAYQRGAILATLDATGCDKGQVEWLREGVMRVTW